MRTCSRCGFAATEEIPALGSDHTWEETSRTEATETISGSIEYTCSTCGAVRNERIPALGGNGSMTALLATISNVLTVVLGWVAAVAEGIWRNPILTIVVIIGFLGTGLLLFKRLLNL